MLISQSFNRIGEPSVTAPDVIHTLVEKFEQHNRQFALMKSTLELHREPSSVRTPQEKKMHSGQIETTDGQIDRLVYGLYGLTEAEVKIVAGK
jgi:hypothetical protein